MYFDEISFLVNETMKGVTSNLSLLPESSGIFYHLQKNENVFILRIETSHNLRVDYEKILIAPEKYPSLRLDSLEKEELEREVSYFECDSLELAQLLKANFANRRFPLFEENIINISDPSYNWWAKFQDNKLKIFFNLSETKNLGSLVKLGPVYDNRLAFLKLPKFYNYLSMLFPIDSFSITKSYFEISSFEKDNQIFKDFVNLFLTGEAQFDFWSTASELEDIALKNNSKNLQNIKEANFFFMEIATFRGFWVHIQEELLKN